MRKFLKTSVLCMLMVILAAMPTEAQINDIAGHWAYTQIIRLTAKSIITGFPDGSFRPGEQITRAQFAQMIVLALNRGQYAKELAGFPSPFKDVKKTYWANGAINEAYELGLIEGYEDGSFGPEKKISRAEMAVLLVKVINLYSPVIETTTIYLPFKDADNIPQWAMKPVSGAVKAGLISGFEDGTYKPERFTTRAEAAVLMNKALEIYGSLFDVEGTVIEVREGSDAVLQEGGGQQEEIKMSDDCQVLLNGQPAKGEFMFGDRVSGIFGQQGTLDYVEIVRSGNSANQ